MVLIRIAALCLLGFLAASPAANADANSAIYYQIGFVWPGAYCEQSNAGCCMPISSVAPAADFYVSGFAVYNATTDAPMTRCSSNTPFNFNEVAKVENIRKYWSNIKCPSNNGKSSWKAAWKTSGVCSGLGLNAYFEAALALRNRINPLALLASQDIRPDYNLYHVEDIKEAIKEGIHVTPLIQCSKGPFDKFMLYQALVCVASDAETLIECPNPHKFTCGDEILFHPFKEWMLKHGKSGAAAYDAAEALELFDAAMDN